MTSRSAESRAPAAAGPAPAGCFVTLDGETCYRIASHHRLPPFLINLASETDLWSFVSSAGGLTAGRRDPDGALFPYETVDRLHVAHHHTGPVTLLRVRRGEGPGLLWEPFAAATDDDPRVERNLYKNVAGNRLVFEEIHHALGLAFRSRWSGCDRFGLVRTAVLENRGGDALAVELLDGVRNLLPFGAPLALYQQSSCLVDAYKRADLDAATGLAIYSLTTRITDRAEAAEVLRANAAWCRGLERFEVALSASAVDSFRRGRVEPGAPVLTGAPGSYLVLASLALPPGGRATWHLAADAGLDHVALEALRGRLRDGGAEASAIETALDEARDELVRIVASADGLQRTGRAEADAHHFANVLFNGMRGGVFIDGHRVPASGLRDFVRARNRTVAARQQAALAALPAALPVDDLLDRAAASGDADLERLCHEFLPIFFARRHGDPSRPWNRFSIRLRDPDGGRALDYEGNWRDIFQNWEALCQGFPRFLPGVIARFVNASTVDGFNPYRLTRDGIDWEVPDPRAPWGNIGYWGDHQIVYLLRFLEALPRHSPGTLEALLERRIFVYADVPYRLAPYADLLAHPRAGISYDAERAARVAARVGAVGADGTLVHDAAEAIHHVTLLEKLLVPALAKVSSFVPGGGIWMNTQRPEWNDANNALAGHGLSMVTLFHLRRYLAFLERLLAARAGTRVPVSREVVAWLRAVHAALRAHGPGSGDDGAGRRALMDALGAAFSSYRAGVYSAGFSGASEDLAGDEAGAFCRCAIEHLDHAIRAARRPDGLVHSYNLLEVAPDGRALVHPLEEMLEGQVAALACGVLTAAEAVTLIDALFASRLYRPDQRAFLLYPVKELPAFLDRNRVALERAARVPLLRALLEAGEPSILRRDAGGSCRFHGDLRSAADLAAALDRLAGRGPWSAPVARDRQAVLDLFEEVFRHHAFTGRSGRMYAYEGIGCVYWHMVAKLLLAVQENALRALRAGEPEPGRALAAAYFAIRSGLGYEKSVFEYGAFPIDPYSHTPARGGAQQPGMTGQVKEEILTRLGELGVVVEHGLVSFRPLLLEQRELLGEPADFRFVDAEGASRRLEVPAGALAFTFCQVPIVYASCRGGAAVRVQRRDGTSAGWVGPGLDAETSRALLARDGSLLRIDVQVPAQAFRAR